MLSLLRPLRSSALDPWELDRTFDRLFDNVLALPKREDQGIPTAEVEDTAEGLQLRLDLPGHDPKDIKVQVENGVLSIRSERKSELKKGAENHAWTEVRYANFIARLRFQKQRMRRKQTLSLKTVF